MKLRTGGGRLKTSYVSRDITRACSSRAGGLVVAQDLAELVARDDVELGEHLAQVVGDGVLADEQPLADRGVRKAVAGESPDLSGAPGEVRRRLDGMFQ